MLISYISIKNCISFYTALFIYKHKSQMHLLQAADYINITGTTVLVIGTQRPWLEAILLTK
jgi:hypothetical protein